MYPTFLPQIMSSPTQDPTSAALPVEDPTPQPPSCGELPGGQQDDEHVVLMAEPDPQLDLGQQSTGDPPTTMGTESPATNGQTTPLVPSTAGKQRARIMPPDQGSKRQPLRKRGRKRKEAASHVAEPEPHNIRVSIVDGQRVVTSVPNHDPIDNIVGLWKEASATSNVGLAAFILRELTNGGI